MSVRRTLACVALFVSAFALYLSNPDSLASYDSMPNSLLAFNVFERHALDFDDFRGSYFTGVGGQYAFVEAPNGHLTSVFPIGTAILTLPIYALFYADARLHGQTPAIATAAFEPERRHDERFAAACVAAFAVVLLWLCARRFANPVPAAIVTAIFALSSPMWALGAQGLWQHASVNLVVLAMIFAFLQASANRDRPMPVAWLILAGLCAGFLPVVRPTAALFSIAGFAFAFFRFRIRAWPIVVAAILGLTPGLAWNAYFFHTLAGGYGHDLTAYTWSAQNVAVAFAGLLISPSRGVIAFTPLVIASAIGAVALLRSRDRDTRLLVFLALASLALAASYSGYRSWWAGFCYGPRFLADTAGISALLILGVLPRDPIAFARRNLGARVVTATFACAFAYTVVVAFAGVYGGAAASDWNSVPVSVDVQPERVWQSRDSQIERSLRATYHRFFVARNVIRKQDYAAGFRGHIIDGIPTSIAAAPNTAFDISARVRNDGHSRWYGFSSGAYIGQARLHAQIYTAGGILVSEQYVYIKHDVHSGETTTAQGTLVTPSAAGDYFLTIAPIALGIAETPSLTNQRRVLLAVSAPPSPTT